MTKWLAIALLWAVPVWAQPQTPSGAGQTATLQNAATGNGNGTVLLTANLSVAVLTVNCASCSGTTINFEGTQDGTNYTPVTATQVGTTNTGTTTTTAGVTVWTFSVAGLTNVRARISAYSAGTVTVTGRATGAGSISSGGGGGSAADVTIHDPTTTSQKVAVNASGQMSITCANCSGSGASAVDRSTWTFGGTSLAPGGGVFDDTPPADLTTGMVGAFRMTAKRGIHVNFRNASGTEIGTLANPIRFDPTGTTTQPVSGTVTANAGTGTFTSDVTDRAARVLGQVTGNVADAAADSGNPIKVGALFETTPPTYTTGQRTTLHTSNRGDLFVTAGTGGLTVTANAGSGTFTVGGTVTANQGGAPWSNNVTQFGGTNVSTGVGASGAGIPRVTVANDSNVLATQSGTWTVQQGTPPWQSVGNVASGAADSGNPLKIGAIFNTTQPTVTTGQRVDVQATARGELLIAKGVTGFSIDNTGFNVTNTPTVVQGNAGSNAQAWWTRLGDATNGPAAVKAASTAPSATDLALVVALSPNSPVPSGANTVTYFGDLAATVTANVKASAGNVYSAYCNNANAGDRYLQLHNTTTTPSAAAVPLYTWRVPGGGDVLIGTDFFTANGAYFSTGIAFAFSTTRDTYTAGAAADKTVVIHYK